MRARRDVSDEARRAEVAASLAAARSVEAELHAPSADAEWHVGPFLVHQREQWDHPAPPGWWVCHERVPNGSRRVAVAPTRELALARGRANAARWPDPLHVPLRAERPPEDADGPETRRAWLRRLARRLLR